MKSNMMRNLKKWFRIFVFVVAVIMVTAMFSKDGHPGKYDFVGYFTAFFLGVAAASNRK